MGPQHNPFLSLRGRLQTPCSLEGFTAKRINTLRPEGCRTYRTLPTHQLVVMSTSLKSSAKRTPEAYSYKSDSSVCWQFLLTVVQHHRFAFRCLSFVKTVAKPVCKREWIAINSSNTDPRIAVHAYPLPHPLPRTQWRTKTYKKWRLSNWGFPVLPTFTFT